jgi:hypothetical protein
VTLGRSPAASRRVAHPPDPRATCRPVGGGVLAPVVTVAGGELLRYAAPGSPDALDSYAASPDDPDGWSQPGQENRGRAHQAGQKLPRSGRAARDAALLQLRSPPQPGPPSSQVVTPWPPVEAAWRAGRGGPGGGGVGPGPLGTLSPDMARLDAEVSRSPAIRMAATTPKPLARALDGHYARAGDEAYALIHEALIIPATSARPRRLLIRLGPLTAAAHPGPGRALRPATATRARYPGTDPSCATKSNPTQPLHKRLPMSNSGPRHPDMLQFPMDGKMEPGRGRRFQRARAVHVPRAQHRHANGSVRGRRR